MADEISTLTPEEQAERLDAAVVCPECKRPTILAIAPAMWTIVTFGTKDSGWAVGRLYAGDGASYPIAKVDRAICNSSSCNWMGTLQEVEVRKPNA